MNLIIQHYFMKQHFLSYLIALLLFPLYEMQAAYQPEFLLPVSMNWQTPDVKYIP